MVALDPVRLLLAGEQPALRDQLGVGLPAVGTTETDPPALQAFQHSFEGGGVTTAQLPVDEPSRGTIPSLPHPELVGLFFSCPPEGVRPAGDENGAASPTRFLPSTTLPRPRLGACSAMAWLGGFLAQKAHVRWG